MFVMALTNVYSHVCGILIFFTAFRRMPGWLVGLLPAPKNGRAEAVVDDHLRGTTFSMFQGCRRYGGRGRVGHCLLTEFR